MCNADGTSPYLRSEVPYNPNTWDGWGRSSQVTYDSTGVTLTTNGVDWIQAPFSTNAKPSTKYGILYNIVSRTSPTGIMLGGVAGYAFVGTTLTNNNGNNKAIMTTPSTITHNVIIFQATRTENNTNVKLSGIRLFELPAGSQIEADFNNLTADELNAKYTFNGLCVKNWRRIIDNGGQTATLPTASYTGYTPYKMIYELATPITTTYVVNRLASHPNNCVFIDNPMDDTGFSRTTPMVFGNTPLMLPNNNKLAEIDNYNGIMSSGDGSLYSVTSNLVGNAPHQLFSFNIIEIVERKYGNIPANNTSDKIQWLRNNLSAFTTRWRGYGVSPQGNRAYVAAFNGTNYVQTGSTTSASPISLSFKSSGAPGWIGHPGGGTAGITSEGFIHFLVHTDAPQIVSVGAVASSTIYTDYVGLEILIKTPQGHDLLVDSNPRRDAGLSTIILVEQTSPHNAVKMFNNDSVQINVNTINRVTAYLAEIDLTPITNRLYGGSNNALKSAVRNINYNIFANGAGSNNGILNNGVVVLPWNGGAWSKSYENISSSASINRISRNIVSNVSLFAGTNNKTYIMITAMHPSDSNIPSIVNLDHFSCRISFSRTPDTVRNTAITVPQRWAAVIKGFSPSWEKEHWDPNDYGIIKFEKTNGDLIGLLETGDKTAKSYRAIARQGGSWILDFRRNMATTLDRFKAFNRVVSYSNGVLNIWDMLNNGQVLKHTQNINLSFMSGDANLMITSNLNGFIESLQLIDLDKIGQSNGLTDSYAEAALKGTMSGYENPELFDINKVVLHPNAIRHNNTIVLTPTVNWSMSDLSVAVLPNNRYELSAVLTGINNSPHISVNEYYNNVIIRTNTIILNQGSSPMTFTTQPITNKVVISLRNRTVDVCQFRDISLKRKD